MLAASKTLCVQQRCVSHTFGGMVKLVNTTDLKSVGLIGLPGSSPGVPTTVFSHTLALRPNTDNIRGHDDIIKIHVESLIWWGNGGEHERAITTDQFGLISAG